MSQPLLISVIVCAISVVLEGVFSGRGLKSRFRSLQMPRFSPPMSFWYVIGGFYYVMCFVVLYRLLRLPDGAIRNTAVVVVFAIMFLNVLWNWVFFRVQNLFISFIWFLPYNVLAIVLLVLVARIDERTSVVIVPYMTYLIYANVWTFRLWRLNRAQSE